MTPEQLAGAGVANPEATAAAYAPIAEWLASARVESVLAALAATGDPAYALTALARLRSVDARPPAAARVPALLQVCGSSPALANALIAAGSGWRGLFDDVAAVDGRPVDDHLRALAQAGATGPVSRAALQAILRRHHRRELVRIGGRDLLGLATVDDTVRELSALADALVIVAAACARALVAVEWADLGTPFVVFGMGKLGGQELNYSSDIDLIYVYETEGAYGERTAREFFARVAEEVTKAIAEVTDDGFCFRVDLRLRPGGGDGPVAVGLDTMLEHYEAVGETWERAVWLKGRPIGGDLAFGERVVAALEPFIFRRYLDYATLNDLQAMKRRVDASFRDPAVWERNVKLGRGGIREVEFVVQADQLIHAGKDARLRGRTTLAVLPRLADCGHLDPTQAAELAAAYRFLRDVEHKLQIVDERQTQLLPVDLDERAALARRMGFRGPEALALFEARLRGHTDVAHAAFARSFESAGAERERQAQPAVAGVMDDLGDDAAVRGRLVALGFKDVDTAVADLLLLRDGQRHAPASPRRRQILAQLAPSLLTEIAESASPDRALHHLASFIAAVGARTSYLHLLAENPGVMRLLVRLFATSEYLSRFFVQHPELIDNLVRADLVRVTRSAAAMAAELRERMAVATDFEVELDTLRRFRHEEFLRIGVHDIEGELPLSAVGQQLSVLAEVCLATAANLARREVLARAALPAGAPVDGLAVVAMGKLGGAELSYNSDLDLIYVYDPGDCAAWGDRTTPQEIFTKIAQRTISILQTPTREGIVYAIDTRLRPSGNQGPLVSAIDAFEAYHRESAQLWERQALIKARVVIGPAGLRERLQGAIDGFVYGGGLAPEGVREIARMRERIAVERGSSAGINIKTDRGGLVDVEFLVQMLQLRHGGTHPALRTATTDVALEAIEALGLLPAADAAVLRGGYAFLRRLESRLRIEHDQAVEALDEHPDVLEAVARALGDLTAGAGERLRRTAEEWRDGIRGVFDRWVAV
jgi:[glutamine synthetase] adenylyltransferase / [glutamine synthetase]-adenylyl-L-tyrosine phosphorylase